MSQRFLVTGAAIAVWLVAVTAAVVLHVMFLWHPVVPRGDQASLEQHLREELTDAADDRRLASAALILLRGGRIASEHTVGVASQRTSAKVSTDQTLFVLASVSKAVTAWGVMNLVEDGRLHLDAPVMRHLRRWRFPSSGAFGDRVTVRHLLSHTAGLDDGLGYGGFGPGEGVQRIEDSLAGPRDSTVGAAGELAVVREPGTAMAYSGGGYAVLQLLVEEVTGRPFADYMANEVLRPLGMSSASFDTEANSSHVRAQRLADGINARLEPQPPRRYAAVASVALHATARDVARFAQAIAAGNSVLKPETVRQMLTAQPGTAGSWGLGHAIFVDDCAGTRVVGHDGGTPPSWGASMRVNPANGNGFVLLASGGGTLVTTLADAWTYSETGVVTDAALRQALIDRIRPTVIAFVMGAAAIAAFSRRFRLFDRQT